MKRYVGFKANVKGMTGMGIYEAFKSNSVPTRLSHGLIYSHVIGPFKTKRGADFMVKYGKNNPHCYHVDNIEKIAKEYAENRSVTNLWKSLGYEV